MNIYSINPGKNYLHVVADFVIRNFYNNIDNVTIILPNYLSLIELKHIIATNIIASKLDSKSCILPQIILLNDLDKIFFGSNQNLSIIDRTEQIITLANIIKIYPYHYFSYIQSLNLAEKINKLLNNDAKPDDRISKETKELLNFVEEKWLEYLKANNKIDFLGYNRNILLDISKHLPNYGKPIILAGIIPSDKYLENFCYSVVGYQHGFWILPPSIKLEQEDVKNLFTKYDLAPNLIKKLSNDTYPYSNFLLEFLVKNNEQNNANQDLPKFEYWTASNIVAESKLVAHLINKLLSSGSICKIAVIINNNYLESLLQNLLTQYKISNTIKKPLINLLQANLLLEIASLFSGELNIEAVINLYKHPYLLKDWVYDLESRIYSSNQDSDEDILEEVSARYKTIKLLLDGLSKIPKQNSYNFSELLKINIEIAESLVPNLWQYDYGNILADRLSNLLVQDLNSDIQLDEYQEILTYFLSNSNYNYKLDLMSSQIIFTTPHNSLLLDMDYVIITGCTDQEWGIDDNFFIEQEENKTDYLKYIFYTLLYYQKIYFTRSSDTEEPLRFLSQLLFLSKKHNVKIDSYSFEQEEVNKISPLKSEGHADLPGKISATSIEILLRNPYGFYAKNILGLRKIDREKFKLSDFGIFIHKVFAEYAALYPSYNHYNNLLDIGWNIFTKKKLDKYQYWWIRFVKIAKEYLAFEKNRRENLSNLYLELYGETEIKIDDRKYIINATADRIEIDRFGNIFIIDYKTGTIASKKEIHQGLSSQLMIEAIIVAKGGFEGILPRIPESLFYIKIANSLPYLRVTEIKLDNTMIKKHEEGLISLLEFFDRKKTYISYPNLLYAPKYDDYKHLARTL